MFNFKNIIRFAVLLIAVSVLACREAIDWELKSGENGRLVVEAILTDELTFQEIKLSKSYDGLNEEAPTVNEANISVAVNGFSIRFFADSLNAGCYKSEVPFAVINNLEYTLNIEWQGERYEAKSFLSNVAPIPEITFQPVGTNGNLSFNESSFLYNANQQAMYEMNIDWSHLSTDSITKAKIIFYTFSSLEESELVRPDFEDIIFPTGSIVILKKFGLNDDFANYLRSLAIETDWNGGAFYSAPSSLPTNISNNGLGFFSTCAVVVDTLIAE
ncbi:MAG: hypothetical protein ACI8P3_004417 [Saprospiraceae bacterium]|jgi:hypothetical protein